MVSAARIAGIIAIAALSVPWRISTASQLLLLYWSLFVYRFQGTRTFLTFVAPFTSTDSVLNILTFAAVLIGGILLIAKPRLPKLGASLVLAGVLLSVVDIANLEFTTNFRLITPIPLGLVFGLAAGITGMVAKRPRLAPAAIPTTENNVDKLLKLKALMDSGAITKEEFEEQKRKVLSP